MKLFAARAEIDAEDIILLYRQLGFSTVDEGLDLVEQAYPGAADPGEGEIPPHRDRRCNAALAGSDLPYTSLSERWTTDPRLPCGRYPWRAG
jgi:hypothetical protein